MVRNSIDYSIQPFFDDKQNPKSLSLALNIISSYIHISLHTHTYTFVFNVWQDANLWITRWQNKETRSTPFKEENLPKNSVKLRGLLFSREDHTWSRACFHQVIHLIKSNLRFHTRLSLYIWSTPTYVFAIGYLIPFNQIRPMFPH